MRPFRALILLSTALAALPAHAQEEIELETMTVSASSTPVALSRTGASVSVLTAQDLQSAGGLSLAERLARAPGVSFTRNGGLGQTAALRLRGLGGAYIGVRMDGIDITDPSSTQTQLDFGPLSTSGLSRVEVLRGAQSALYGANAVGGVIDINTWRPTREGSSGTAAVEAGTYGTLSGQASAGVKGARGEFALTASRTVTSGFSAYADGREADGLRSNALNFYGAYDLTETFRIGANGFWRQSHAEFDDSTADAANDSDSTLRGARLFAQFETGAVSHEISLGRSKTERAYTYPASNAFSPFDGTRTHYRYAGSWAASEQLQLDWGAERTREDFATSYDSVDPVWGAYHSDASGAASTNSVFGELRYAPAGAVDLSFALRHDVHSDFGARTTGRLAAAWRPAEDWVLRAVAATGFRAPSLYELHSSYGDPDLRPETSRSYELGLERLFAGGSVQATLFDTRIENLIQATGFSCIEGYYCYEQIDGTAKTRGLELSGTAELRPGWSLFGNYTYTDAKGPDGRLIRVPRQSLNAGVEGVLAPQWTGRLAATYAADRVDTTYPDGPTPMPDYTVVDVSLTYAVSDATQAYLRVENLFDEDYQTVRNYRQPGRSLYVGLRTAF